MRPLRLLGSLALLLAVTACIGQPAATPTPSPKPQLTATVGSNIKIVTDIGGESPATGTPTTPTPTATEVLPTNTPLPLARLEILSQSTYKDSAGGMWVVGEAQNTGTATATDIEITLTLLGANGKPSVVSYATTHLSEVPPGGKTPFRGLFATPPQGAQQVQVSARTVPAYPDTKSDLAPGIAVQDSKLAPAVGASGAVVSGQIKNGGNQIASLVRVLAVSRGADGKVTDVADGYAEAANIAPGGQAPFSVQFPQAKEAPSFEVFAQGLVKLSTTLPTPTATVPTTPTPTGTPPTITVPTTPKPTSPTPASAAPSGGTPAAGITPPPGITPLAGTTPTPRA